MKQCVVLVGGKGTRLGDITKYTPKPMLIINNKPFLINLIETIIRYGFTEILLLASHANQVLIDYFDNKTYKNCKIKIIVEKVPLGTGGALVNAYEYLDDSFFCLNGDSVIDGNWLSLVENFHNDVDAVIGLTETKDASRYGSIKTKDKKVISFNEKNQNSNSKLINGGIYLLRKSIFKNFEKIFLSLENDIFPNLVNNGKVNGQKVQGFFIDIGTVESLEYAKKINWQENRKAVIFDRDGTLNHDAGYTHKPEELSWANGAVDLIKYLNDHNYLVFVATNQAGIAKGKFLESDMFQFHENMQEQLRNVGAHIDKFYYCPFHIEGVIDQYKIDSNDRKPNVGMLQSIYQEWNLKKSKMIMIGDRDTDIECAEKFKIQGYKYNIKDDIMEFFKNKINF